MKDKIQLSVCLLVGVTCALILVAFRAGDKYREYKALLGESLTEVLRRELAVRDTGNVSVTMAMDATADWMDELPDTVRGYIHTAEGMVYYKVPREKYRNNIGQNRDIRVYHSYLMMEYPVSADSLCRHWRQTEWGCSDGGAVGLRLRVPGREVTSCLPDSLTLAHADSTCVRYAGNYCELEAVAYSSVGRYELLGWGDWLFAVFWGGASCLMSGFLWNRLRSRRSLRRQSEAENVSCEPLSTSVELCEDEGEGSDMDEGVKCRLENGCLYGPHGSVQLTHKEKMLMEQFLSSTDGKQVEKEVLCRTLWPKVPEVSAINSLRATVSRLRNKLQKIGIDIRSLGDSYCLISLEE